jgi:3-hydroxybutyrate dehydrogenase
MNMQLQGKRALITGAASGMGRSIALAFADEGASLVIHGRSEESLSGLANEIKSKGAEASIVTADLADNKLIEKFCSDTLSALGGIDIVVNNAGAVSKAPLTGTSEEAWDKIMQVNLKTPFLISKYLVDAMRENKNGGRMIFISSIAAKLADPVGSAYNASKAGVLGLVRSMAAELGADGITVNTICPGWVDTPMAVRLHKEMPADDETNFDEFYDSAMRSNMLGAKIQPDDIAELAVFLASDKGKTITAQAMNVCAGVCVS